MSADVSGTVDVPQAVRDVLVDVVGLREIDMTDDLHRRLVDAVVRLGPNASLGQRVVAVRFEFNWELSVAGTDFARAKTDYERFKAKSKVRLFADDPKLSSVKAEAMVDADDEAYRLLLRYRLAEQRERAMRKFLDTLDAALENHRTDRADWRAGDQAHARGLTGGA